MSEYYPIVVMEDRYSGVYSGDRWIAIAGASELVDETTTRAQFCLIGIGGPSDSDVEAAGFWQDRPEWIGVGSTPEEAIAAIGKAMPKPRLINFKDIRKK